MEPSTAIHIQSFSDEDRDDEHVDPINDIIDYPVRCAKISFKSAHVNEAEIKTGEKIIIAAKHFKQSPLNFLMQFGKYLAPYHIRYFEELQPNLQEKGHYQECIAYLKKYHSEESSHKRIRNRRYQALVKLQNEGNYFSEKQMMYRDPLLYEQLIGQYLTDEEIRERDENDNESLTLLNLILETVDRNQMRQLKNEQVLREKTETNAASESVIKHDSCKPKMKKQWGDFDEPDSTPGFTPEVRKQSMITAPERRLLREEFLQEMYSSFIEGRDADVDYKSIDNDEQYDDLQQASQDAEDRYFDSETNDTENLEEHMKLIQEYGRNSSSDETAHDPLDVFMEHITIKHNTYLSFLF